MGVVLPLFAFRDLRVAELDERTSGFGLEGGPFSLSVGALAAPRLWMHAEIGGSSARSSFNGVDVRESHLRLLGHASILTHPQSSTTLFVGPSLGMLRSTRSDGDNRLGVAIGGHLGVLAHLTSRVSLRGGVEVAYTKGNTGPAGSRDLDWRGKQVMLRLGLDYWFGGDRRAEQSAASKAGRQRKPPRSAVPHERFEAAYALQDWRLSLAGDVQEGADLLRVSVRAPRWADGPRWKGCKLQLGDGETDLLLSGHSVDASHEQIESYVELGALRRWLDHEHPAVRVCGVRRTLGERDLLEARSVLAAHAAALQHATRKPPGRLFRLKLLGYQTGFDVRSDGQLVVAIARQGSRPAWQDCALKLQSGGDLRVSTQPSQHTFRPRDEGGVNEQLTLRVSRAAFKSWIDASEPRLNVCGKPVRKLSGWERVRAASWLSTRHEPERQQSPAPERDGTAEESAVESELPVDSDTEAPPSEAATQSTADPEEAAPASTELPPASGPSSADSVR